MLQLLQLVISAAIIFNRQQRRCEIMATALYTTKRFNLVATETGEC